jgi:hypothetical protein
MAAVILSRETDHDVLKETQVDAVMENPRSEEAALAIEYLVENWDEVCIAARFIGEGEAAYQEAYERINRYVGFLRSKSSVVSPMLDADFYRDKVKNDFRKTEDGMERSFIVRLSPPKARKSEGFAI